MIKITTHSINKGLMLSAPTFKMLRFIHKAFSEIEGLTCEIEGLICEIEGQTCEIEGYICKIEGNTCEIEGQTCEIEGYIGEIGRSFCLSEERWLQEVMT